MAHTDKERLWRFGPKSGSVSEVTFEPVAVVPEPAVLRTMLIGGVGVGRLPDFHAVDAIADGSLVRLLQEWLSGSVDAHALHPSHRSLSAKVRVFIDTMIEHLAHASGPANASS